MADIKKHVLPGDDEYEHRDMGPGVLVGFMITLVVMVVVANIVVKVAFKLMDHYEMTHQKEGSPLVPPATGDMHEVDADAAKHFPTPSLETDEDTEIYGFMLKQEQTLSTYGWVDQGAGTVHIPIDRAMDLIAQRGLPTSPRAGQAPASEVNTVNQAAMKSDTSGAPAAQKSKTKPSTK
jgi:hypothetical protein